MFHIIECEFLKPGVHPELHQTTSTPLIVFLGRSNVGKSSLLNYLVGQHRMARVSNTPGRTQDVMTFSATLKHEEHALKLYLVDLPGYGYSELSLDKQKHLFKGLKHFWTQINPQNCLAFHLFDSRREPTEQDIEIKDYLKSLSVHYQLILTKSDQIIKSKQKPKIKAIQDQFKLTPHEVHMISAKENVGKEILWNEAWQHFAN